MDLFSTWRSTAVRHCQEYSPRANVLNGWVVDGGEASQARLIGFDVTIRYCHVGLARHKFVTSLLQTRYRLVIGQFECISHQIK